jgi:hypothetical protein
VEHESREIFFLIQDSLLDCLDGVGSHGADPWEAGLLPERFDLDQPVEVLVAGIDFELEAL